MNEYKVSLVNKDGCNFDNATFTSLERAKDWAKGRSGHYKAYITVNYDADTNTAEEEIVINY